MKDKQIEAPLLQSLPGTATSPLFDISRPMQTLRGTLFPAGNLDQESYRGAHCAALPACRGDDRLTPSGDTSSGDTGPPEPSPRSWLRRQQLLGGWGLCGGFIYKTHTQRQNY